MHEPYHHDTTARRPTGTSATSTVADVPCVRREVEPAVSTPRDGALVIAPSQPAPQWIVLEVAGGLDLAGAPRLRTALNQAIVAVVGEAARGDLAPTCDAPTRARIVCDLDGVGFLGAAGIAVLLEATAAAHADDVDLVIRAQRRAVLRALTITDTMRHLRWETERPRSVVDPAHAA